MGKVVSPEDKVGKFRLHVKVSRLFPHNYALAANNNNVLRTFFFHRLYRQELSFHFFPPPPPNLLFGVFFQNYVP